MKTKICVLLITLLGSLSFSYAQESYQDFKNLTKNNRVEIESIRSELDILKERFETNKDGYQIVYDGLGNVIQVSIAIIAVILTAGGFFISKYVSGKLNLIEEAKKSVDESLKKIKETDDFVKENNDLLFDKVYRNMTLKYLERLVEVPEDAHNLHSIMFAIDLLPEDFLKLRDGFLKIKDNPDQNQITQIFICIMAQHFPLETLRNPETYQGLLKVSSYNIVQGMFERDIKSFFVALLEFIKDKDLMIDQYKTLLHSFFLSLYQSKHKNNVDIFDIIKNTIASKNINSIELRTLLTKEQTDQNYLQWLDSKIFN